MLKQSKDNLTETKVVDWKIRFIGICLTFLQALLLLCMNTMVKKMELHYNDVMLIKSIGLILVALLFFIKTRRSIWPSEVDEGKSIKQIRTLLIVYGITVGIVNLSDLIAISFMPLGDAMVIILSSVLPTVILSRIFLKERLKLYKLICTVVIICGIILITRPPFLFKDTIILNNTHIDSYSDKYSSEIDTYRSIYYYYGVISALICTLSIGTFTVVFKILIQNKSTSYIELSLLYSGFGCLIVSLLVPAFGGKQKIIFPSPQVEQYDTWQWLSLFIVVILGITNFFVRFKAIKLIGPVIFGFIRTSEIIIAYFIQTIFFNTVPHTSSLIGSGCVTMACIGILLEDNFLGILHPSVRNIF